MLRCWHVRSFTAVISSQRGLSFPYALLRFCYISESNLSMSIISSEGHERCHIMSIYIEILQSFRASFIYKSLQSEWKGHRTWLAQLHRLVCLTQGCSSKKEKKKYLPLNKTAYFPQGWKCCSGACLQAGLWTQCWTPAVCGGESLLMLWSNTAVIADEVPVWPSAQQAEQGQASPLPLCPITPELCRAGHSIQAAENTPESKPLKKWIYKLWEYTVAS